MADIRRHPQEKGRLFSYRACYVVCRYRDKNICYSEIDSEYADFYQDREKNFPSYKREHLSDRVVDELKEREFVHIDSEKIKYYKKLELFGPVVGEKFPKLIEDISSSGTCYALGQHTACVFHLMRVMENCVQRLGKKLKVSIDTRTKSWHQIMMHVHKQIEQMPGGKKANVAQNNKKNNLAAAAARLDHVRISWRNDVMHPKDTYDEEQALEVLTSVGAFLKSVAPLL